MVEQGTKKDVNMVSEKMQVNDIVSAHDVAAYILEQAGEMSTLKLQKLVYYSQAWSLVWDDSPLFSENIEAWANGPVVRELFEGHRGRFSVSTWDQGNSSRLSEEQRRTIDSVIEYYGDKNSHWLSELTHMEDPWKLARGGTPDGMRSSNIITLDSMAQYYSNL